MTTLQKIHKALVALGTVVVGLALLPLATAEHAGVPTWVFADLALAALVIPILSAGLKQYTDDPDKPIQ